MRKTLCVLSALVLATLEIAGWSRYIRSSMLEVAAQDYVRTAQAKGLAQRLVLYRHMLRNALLPLISKQYDQVDEERRGVVRSMQMLADEARSFTSGLSGAGRRMKKRQRTDGGTAGAGRLR